uniref:Auxin-responsive protein n=1 Tax=Galium aparine TaxID=29788 RepID=A0A896VY28_GALAP|nr:IAA26 [Galium aparine]
MESCPKLLDLIPKREIMEEVSEEKKLELRLGPPGGGDYNNTITSGTKRGFTDCVNGDKQAQKHLSSFCDDRVFAAPWKNPCSSSQQAKAVDSSSSTFLKLQSNSQCLSKESPEKHSTAVPAQKRTTPALAPVVGWPPIRSFRKNLASSSNSLKTNSGSQNLASTPNKTFGETNVAEKSCPKGLFVKINMDGVPIGRKVDLKTYDSYDKLSTAVDELFRGLLAAQGETSVGVIQTKGEEEKVISGLLDGSGEYTLVYEDNEGDRMLVGDVPWHMFVSTVKRLRVLKSSEISKLCGVNKQGKLSLDASLR